MIPVRPVRDVCHVGGEGGEKCVFDGIADSGATCWITRQVDMLPTLGEATPASDSRRASCVNMLETIQFTAGSL